jgi:hypothetical protein
VSAFAGQKKLETRQIWRKSLRHPSHSPFSRMPRRMRDRQVRSESSDIPLPCRSGCPPLPVSGRENFSHFSSFLLSSEAFRFLESVRMKQAAKQGSCSADVCKHGDRVLVPPTSTFVRVDGFQSDPVFPPQSTKMPL